MRAALMVIQGGSSFFRTGRKTREVHLHRHTSHSKITYTYYEFYLLKTFFTILFSPSTIFTR